MIYFQEHNDIFHMVLLHVKTKNAWVNLQLITQVKNLKGAMHLNLGMSQVEKEPDAYKAFRKWGIQIHFIFSLKLVYWGDYKPI